MLKQFTGCITYDMLDEVVDFEAMETEGMDLGGLMMEFTDPGYNTKRECKADIRAAYKHWLKLGIMKPNKLRFLSSQVSEVELYADDEDRMMTERLHEELDSSRITEKLKEDAKKVIEINRKIAKVNDKIKEANRTEENLTQINLHLSDMLDSWHEIAALRFKLVRLNLPIADKLRELMLDVAVPLDNLKIEAAAL